MPDLQDEERVPGLIATNAAYEMHSTRAVSMSD